MYVWKRKLLDKGQVCVCVRGFGNVVLEKKWTQSLNWNSCSSNRLKYDFEPNTETHGHFILRPLFCRLCFGVLLWLQQEGAKGRAGAGCACGFTGQCCTRCVRTNSTASQVTFIVSGTSWGSKCYGKAAHCWPWLFCLLSTGQIPAGRQQWARPSHRRGMAERWPEILWPDVHVQIAPGPCLQSPLGTGGPTVANTLLQYWRDCSAASFLLAHH